MEDKVLRSIDKYFNVLTVTGYRKQKDVNALIVLSFINKFLLGDTADFITDDDYKSIDRALYCLYGENCLISFPRYKDLRTTLKAKYDEFSPRSTEDYILRSTEGGNTRSKDFY